MLPVQRSCNSEAIIWYSLDISDLALSPNQTRFFEETGTIWESTSHLDWHLEGSKNAQVFIIQFQYGTPVGERGGLYFQALLLSTIPGDEHTGYDDLARESEARRSPSNNQMLQSHQMTIIYRSSYSQHYFGRHLSCVYIKLKEGTLGYALCVLVLALGFSHSLLECWIIERNDLMTKNMPSKESASQLVSLLHICRC